MNLKEIQKVVGMIQTHVFRNSNSYTSGILKSHFRGSGLQFKEHQVYVPGDDVRFIDWKLSAKSSQAFVKTFEEERNVEIFICVDLTPTLYYGHNRISKLQAMIETVALFYLLAKETQDLVRVVLWGAGEEVILPAKKGHEGLVFFIAHLERLGILKEDGTPNFEMQFKLRPIEEKKKIIRIKTLLARRKEVIYLGDLSAIESIEDFSKLFSFKNMNCFRFYSPVDKLTKSPFFMKIKTGSGKVVSGEVQIQDQELLKKQRYKEIGVHERYLEKVVRELM